MYTTSLAILRPAVVPDTFDEDGLPVYGDPTTVATVPAAIQPVTLIEQAQLADQGAVVGNYRAFLDPTDILASDQVEDTTTSLVYEVRSVADAAGRAHHIEAMLWLKVD